MSLLLLFNPSPGIVHTTPSPAELIAVEMVTPELTFVQDTQYSMPETDETYNDSSIEYSSSSQVYGGANLERGGKPEMLDIETVVPSMDEDGEL